MIRAADETPACQDELAQRLIDREIDPGVDERPDVPQDQGGRSSVSCSDFGWSSATVAPRFPQVLAAPGSKVGRSDRGGRIDLADAAFVSARG